MTVSKINQIVLKNFRSYSEYSFDISADNIVIYGKNGIGKTNLIEAICQFGSVSTFSPVFRKAKLFDMGNINIYPLNKWQVYLNINNDEINYDLSVEYTYSKKNNPQVTKDKCDIVEYEVNDNESSGKKFFINGKKAQVKSDVFDYLRIVWLTPFMDRIFTDSSIDRRRFFDGLIGSFNRMYFDMLNEYNNLLRARSKLLKSQKHDVLWLDSIEKKLSELCIAIAVSRLEFVTEINKMLVSSNRNFPRVLLSVDGMVEDFLQNGKSALEVEILFKDMLFDNRSDFEKSVFACSPGIHRSEFSVFHIKNNLPVAMCSTGEQKLSLLSVILAYANMVKSVFNMNPIIVIDELPAHIDKINLNLFLYELQKLGSQNFFTGTDIDFFSALKGTSFKSQFILLE